MTVITQPTAQKVVRELKNLRTSTSGQRLKLAFCHGCHRYHAPRPDRSR